MPNNFLFTGIDIGSSFTKAVTINANKIIIGSSTIHSGIKLRVAAEKALIKSLSAKSDQENIKKMVITGYGRKNTHFEDIVTSNITEISCSARAARFVYPEEDVTIVDIGGQDSKIIKIRDGRRSSFKMNRKCAAGTGTFLEELALKLRIEPTELNNLGKL
ncbi:MAG: BadF/BadG/BcrA/BcrD ATPase family protein, partial [Candidatus Hodarchaeales archaeon]